MKKKERVLKSELQEKTIYTDEEVNELAEWLQDLTLKQAFFLKESYEGYLNQQATSCGGEYAH